MAIRPPFDELRETPYLPPMTYELNAGSLANLRLVDTPLPTPAPGEVSVAVRAIGLNFADVFAIWRLYGATPEGTFTPGLEYAGNKEGHWGVLALE